MNRKQAVPDDYRPRDLGRQAGTPADRIDRIPWRGSPILVTLECDEFTSLCPVTGQPDFGTLSIQYTPRQYLVESKSLKLFLWQYRERGVFSEALVEELADELFARLAPLWIEVEGRFASRGGIRITARARRSAE